MVDQSQLDQDLDYINIGQKEGAKLVAGGELLNRETPGFYLAPALFTEVDNNMRIAREEIFGPVADRDPRQGLRRRPGHRQRHAIRPLGRHLHQRR